MTMGKVLFFDIDGTLVDSNGDVAESTKSALRRAKERGHKLFLCTGRTKSQIVPELWELGFDGVVAVAGAEVWVEDQVIFHSFMEEEKVEQFLRFFERKDCSYGLQTAAGSLCTKEGWEKTRQRFVTLGAPEKVTTTNMRFFEIVDTLHGRQDVEKLFYNFVPETVEEIQAILGSYFYVEQNSFTGPDPHSGEITKAGVDKSTGMSAVMEYYHLPPEESVAFGDGLNDVTMLSYAGIGVAMGNARPEILAMADYITEDIFHDGIFLAMQHLNLI